MQRYYIEDAKCGVVSYGPTGFVVVTVGFNDGAETQWLHMVDVDGILNVVLTEKDIHDELMANEDDEAFNEYVNEHNIYEFEGIDFDGDYVTTYNSLHENPDNPATALIRYAVTLVQCPMDEVDGLIELAVGKYIDEVDVPMCEEEMDWLEEMEEEEEDE